MNIAFVVQRYGDGVVGGAETVCRSTARALVRAGDRVTVHTTTARDYLTWRPHFAPGSEEDDGVVVHRFHAEQPDTARGERLLRALALGGGDAAMEREWARAQGPVSPGLLATMARRSSRYDVVVLWTYLFATTQMAMPLVTDRSVLVPLAHDEPMFRLSLTRGLVRMARGLAFMTPEERRLVDDLHGIGDRAEAVVGAGIGPSPAVADVRRAMPGLPPRFALYLGRLDPSKGLGGLVRAHAAHRRSGGACGLVLAGRADGSLPLPDWVVATGYVDDATRAGLLDACEVVVLPSAQESLSLVALEAWRARRPTLANAASEVLAGQTARSGGGLLYDDDATYRRALARLEADAALRGRLGEHGAAWSAGQTWDACVARWQPLLRQVRRTTAPV